MIDDLAPRVDTAGSRTRVPALLVDASLVLRALGTGDALGPASGRRADEAGLARAHGVAAGDAAQAVGPARRRLARVLRGQDGHGLLAARLERVAPEARHARAHGHVVHHAALGVGAAHAAAGITAVLREAGQVAGAVRVDAALGPAAAGVWVTHVRGNARAARGAVMRIALGVFAARRWHTRVGWGRRRQVSCNNTVTHT